MADNIASATIADFPAGTGEQEFTDDLAVMTSEPDEVPGYFYTSWYAVTVGTSADVTVHVDWDIVDPENLVIVAWKDNSGTLDFTTFEQQLDAVVDAFTLHFPLEPGDIRYIQVAGVYEDYHAPFTLTVTAAPPAFHPVGDEGGFAGPYKVVISDEMTPSVSPSRPALAYPEADLEDSSLYCPVWFVYVPSVDGVLIIDTQLGTQSYGTRLDLFQGADLITDTRASITLLQTEYQHFGFGYSEITNAVTAGIAYWITVSSMDGPGNPLDYVLRAAGPATVDYGTGIVAPSFDTIVEAPVPSLGAVQVVAPPMETVTELSGSILKVVAAPPIESSITLRAPSMARIRRVLGRPSDNTIVPVNLPQYTVGVQVLEGEYDSIAVDLQVDDAGSLTGGSPIVSQDVDTGLSFHLVTFNADTPLANGGYQWRARLVLDGTPQAWTDARTFTVDTSASDAAAPITWTVTGATTYPHLWSFSPEAGVPGTQVTILGQGLPLTPTVTIAGVTAALGSVTHVSATVAAITVDRTLADVEHDEIIVTVPIVNAPGGPLVVGGSY